MPSCWPARNGATINHHSPRPTGLADPQPQLTAGIISGGAVGLAIAEALLQAGHRIHGVVAPSPRSRGRLAERLPRTPVLDIEQAAAAGLIVLAVPDTVLPQVVAEVAKHTAPGQLVAHTAGAFGCEILQPITDTGAIPLALHPAMSFIGEPRDTHRLQGCAWGVTADSDEGFAVAEVLVQALGGVPVRIQEQRRRLYHSALAHAGNHLVTVLSDAQRMMDYALARPETPEPEDPGHAASSAVVGHFPESALLVRALAGAALDNALSDRMDALTGPVARDDAPAVLRHLEAIGELPEPAGRGLQRVYRDLSRRTAQLRHAIDVERVLGD